MQEVCNNNEAVTKDPPEHEKTSCVLKEAENSDNNSKQHRSKYSNIFRCYSCHKSISMSIIIILYSYYISIFTGEMRQWTATFLSKI